jgi:Na+/phosphate symporter
MNTKTELKVLKEFIKILDDPKKSEMKFRRHAKVMMLISVLMLFFLFSDNIELFSSKYVFTGICFLSGAIFGLSLWFLQASTQTSIMVKHMSKDSVLHRLDELNT